MTSARDARVDRQLRYLACIAPDPAPPGAHVDEPVLALLRDGDVSDDLDDARGHIAACADCRARLTEGDVERRKYVVLAIEAPRASARNLEEAAEAASARLVERGEGRWAAVVPAAKAEALKGSLDKPESVVSRIAVGAPFEVPVDEARAPRKKLDSYIDEVPAHTGTDAAEVQVWAQVAAKPARRRASAGSAGWLLFAVLAIGSSVAIAWFLATR